MAEPPPLRPATLAARGHAGPDAATHGVAAPILPSTTYERAPDYTLPAGRSYARPENPTFDRPEALLTALEGGADAMLFASGMAAATAAGRAVE